MKGVHAYFRSLCFLDEFNIDDDDKDRYVCIVCINVRTISNPIASNGKRENEKRRNFYCKSPHILLLGNCDDGGKERERDPPDNYDDPSSLPLRNKVFHIVHCYTIQVWKWRLTAIVHTKTW